MKVITKRDLVVVQCVLVYDPNVAGVTIEKYVSTDSVAPEYETAIVSVPGLHGTIRVKVKKEEGGQWIPISVSIPGEFEVCGVGVVYNVLVGLGGIALRKRY